MPKLSTVQQRAMKTSIDIALNPPEHVAYQHTVLCQTVLPYRNPGDDVYEWQREQGVASLLIESGRARHPRTKEWIKLRLPYGPKPRLILAYLNAEALRTGSPDVEVEETLTAFVRRIQDPLRSGKAGPNGAEIKAFKEQLARLAAATIRMAMTPHNRAIQIDTKIVTAFDLWFQKDERQRVLWPSIIRLSLDYYKSLQDHAVPLDERALAALAHNAMALDTYAWLAQRLHRIRTQTPQFIPWPAIQDQFGQGYSRLRKFREVFLHALRLVHSQYETARIEIDTKGITLRCSPPPVLNRHLLAKPCG